MHYLLVARDDRFWLVGPFATYETAGKWGSDPVNNPADDPRWQTIQIADASAPVEIIPPLQPMPAR